MYMCARARMCACGCLSVGSRTIRRRRMAFRRFRLDDDKSRARARVYSSVSDNASLISELYPLLSRYNAYIRTRDIYRSTVCPQCYSILNLLRKHERVVKAMRTRQNTTRNAVRVHAHACMRTRCRK